MLTETSFPLPSGAWIVLATCGVFVLLPGPVTSTPGTMTTAQVLAIGIGTTAGIAGQAAWVVAALRHSGFRWSWRARPLPCTLRPVRVGVPILGWLPVYAAISQVSVAITMRVAFDHDGVSINNYAELLFQVPYGILAASVLTVLMPRISRAAARDFTAVAASVHRVVFATVLAGATTLATIVLTTTTIDTPSLAQITTLAAGFATGSAVFLLAAKVIGIPELRVARALPTRA